MNNLDDTVHLPGAMEQTEIINALKSADLFVLPCVKEKNGMQDGIPVVLMEAMAMGIPVISTNISGVPELVRDGAGVLVEPEDPDALSDAIMTTILSDIKDRERIGRKGRAIVEADFNIKKEVQKLAKLISA